MSDFDEEAERERLREKYEKDEERRKETQQMSELLLKGATMTNRHCGECGSPIFRYQGQEFCPSCQRVTGGEAASGGETAESSPADADGSSAEPAPRADADTADRPSTNGTVAPDSTPEPDAADVDAAATAGGSAASPQQTRESGPETATDAGVGVSPKPGAMDDRSADSGVTPRRPSADAVGSSSATDDEPPAASERTAREALLRALTRHARLAEETGDPRQAKAHLAAAREAAEAVDELE
ncbi:Sjogren's syndrome/scleroderma autoantigen 1 family protein [Halobellus limi]|uniref:Sjogren's syndrome/scleroderma autoantigen 1 (Autoantigen p27) n=1 Tax=Halobellus limi TaxID=699433 RepID=A0A1H5X0X1_9EURY|nr:Sjogren's syndrome/scleroderma autoantigen 1 family protein [Halobellus limi]QCC46291.1 hypothetical protein DV707_00555 [Halobellus limi]SEG05045.1 Sjogren's syndrome/scleroderma autoantigen 1 (Autoantigen p27) [Halobellus limi]